MAAVGLLRDRPAPTEQEVREALDGNLCRCGTHGRIIRAGRKAAGRMAGGGAVVRRPPAAEVLRSQVAAGGAEPVEGPVRAPPAVSPRRLVAESGVPTGVSPLPADLAANPVLARWLDFSRDGEVTVRTGKVEYGQGIGTALAQVAAEELQVALARVRVAPVSTSTSPDEGVTAGSLSVQDSGSALRQACAQARDLLLDAAAARLGLAHAELAVADGQIRAADRPTGLRYWTLAQPGMLDPPADGPVPARPAGAWSGGEPGVDQRAAEAAGTAPRPLTAEFTRPFLAHASVAPSCAIAHWDRGSVTVWSHSQGIFLLRDAIAAGLGLDAAQVTVHYVEGAGVYGQNGADDVAMDTVLLARAVPGRPVRVQWTREDEMCWSPLGSAMLARLSASLDAGGKIATWRQDVWSNGFMGRPPMGGDPRLLALTHPAR